jgi:Flp pilus assembly pilin Flp
MLIGSSERGQGLVEYAMILILAVMVIIVVLALFGPAVGAMYSNIIASIP